MAKFTPKIEGNKDVSNVGISKINIKKLPSGGLSYPKNFQLSYRPYTWGEVKSISGSKDLTIEDTAKYVLNGIECDFDKLKITLSDFLYLGYLRKLSNNLAGKTITAILICAECQEQDSYTISSEEIDFDNIGCNKLPVNVSVNNVSLSFVPFTIGDYLNLTKNDRGLDTVTQMAYMAIKGKYDGYQKVYDTLYNASSEDGDLLEEVNTILYHGIKPINVGCKCGNKIGIELDSSLTTDGGKVILQPFRKHEDDVRSRISFGN